MIHLVSFAYSVGIPEADKVFDARNLANPHRLEALRSMDGTDDRIQTWILQQSPDQAQILLDAMMTYGEETHLAVGCFGGKHRSVAVVEMAAARFGHRGVDVQITHRELGVSTFKTAKPLVFHGSD